MKNIIEDIIDDLKEQLTPYGLLVIKVFLIPAIILLALFITDHNNHYGESAIGSPLTPIAYHFTDNELIFDPNTNIVYIRTRNNITPYFSENGNLCRFVNGKITEIESSH